MRIISGNYKNKKLYFPKNSKTRPLKDSVKENIFNILNHSTKIKIRIKNSSILDLYSGSGSFGLECISRQAAKVFFGRGQLQFFFSRGLFLVLGTRFLQLADMDGTSWSCPGSLRIGCHCILSPKSLHNSSKHDPMLLQEC